MLLSQAPAPVEPRQFEELTRRVDLAVREHRQIEAIGMIDKALKSNPKWAQGWWLLGSLLYDNDNYVAARPALERLLALDPKSGAGWAVLGLCEFEMRDYGLALQHLQRGDAYGLPRELDLVDVVRYHEVLALMVAGRFDPAQVLLDQLTQKGVDTEEIVLTQGMVALRIPALPVLLSRAASDDRMQVIRQVGRAQHLVSQQKPREAADVYKELLQSDPRIPNLHLSYSLVLSHIKEPKAAEAELRAELALDPQSVEARLQLCNLLEDESPQEAMTLAAQAVAQDPKSFKAHFVLGKLLFKEDKFAESAKELETSRDIDPSSSAVRFALVRTYKALGKESEAARESAVFRRLRAAEDQFRTTGRVSQTYFEPDTASPQPAGKTSSKAPH